MLYLPGLPTYFFLTVAAETTKNTEFRLRISLWKKEKELLGTETQSTLRTTFTVGKVSGDQVMTKYSRAL